MRIATIVGARPQFVKAAMVSREFKSHSGCEEILIHTGQHYDRNMSDVFFREMRIPRPQYRLEIGSGSHGKQTGRMLEQIESVLIKEAPDMVLVYGDTNSTLAGALAATKLHIPVAHVEAGLRSFNRLMPEEANRVLTDHVSQLLFVPTRQACKNLEREGIPAGNVKLVGDVMYDATLHYRKLSMQRDIAVQADVGAKAFVLATIHRAENTDDPSRLEAIFCAFQELSRRLPVVLPLHPRTKTALEKAGLFGRSNARLHFIEPVGYLDMLRLESAAQLIVTDSGGVQKEAFFLGVPCLTLRDETEWSELVESGWNRLVPPRSHTLILSELVAALEQPCPKPPKVSPYGEGDASRRIVESLAANSYACKGAA